MKKGANQSQQLLQEKHDELHPHLLQSCDKKSLIHNIWI